MPRYTFRCSKGHVTEEVRPVSESKKPIRCKCGARAKRDFLADMRTVGNNLPQPIPEHYNRSFGTTVSSREHLEQLQAKKGFSDYDPKFMPEPSTGWK